MAGRFAVLLTWRHPPKNSSKEAHVQGFAGRSRYSGVPSAFSETIYNALDRVRVGSHRELPETSELLPRIDSMRQSKLRHAEDAVAATEGQRPDKQLVSMFLAEGMDLIVDAAMCCVTGKKTRYPANSLITCAVSCVMARSASAAQLPEVVALWAWRWKNL